MEESSSQSGISKDSGVSLKDLALRADSGCPADDFGVSLDSGKVSVTLDDGKPTDSSLDEPETEDLQDSEEFVDTKESKDVKASTSDDEKQSEEFLDTKESTEVKPSTSDDEKQSEEFLDTKESTEVKPSTSDDENERFESPSRSRKSSTSTEEESTVDEIAAKFRPPPHKWNLLKSQRKREYGLRAREAPSLFRYRTMGSLHMAQRLELMYKLENHTGCVNCLNFNASGTRLASGSDDTNVTIWDWATGEAVLTFDTRHRSNVFQVGSRPGP